MKLFLPNYFIMLNFNFTNSSGDLLFSPLHPIFSVKNALPLFCFFLTTFFATFSLYIQYTISFHFCCNHSLMFTFCHSQPLSFHNSTKHSFYISHYCNLTYFCGILLHNLFHLIPIHFHIIFFPIPTFYSFCWEVILWILFSHRLSLLVGLLLLPCISASMFFYHLAPSSEIINPAGSSKVNISHNVC